ncbi:hypothetical protein [Lysinibacillus xylanilyticus]|uniref:hypothetical protein n=1 Tax=Lysinibacillus xylanilyticus TaxID=582475 RepID=UPI00083CA25C|nr:hypothetical protein [Lysinibacillus xylanilyticus]
MKNHIYQVHYLKQSNSPKARFKDLKYLIRESDLDKLIGETFPLTEFDLESEMLIEGSKELLTLFEKVDEEKLDIIEELRNMEYIGLSDNNEIILRFNNKDLEEDFNAIGIYDFTYDFLDDIFHMGKFSKYCISNSYRDLLKENIIQLFEKEPSLQKQYRLIKNNEKWFLRGLTSTRYNNYDNHLAIYLTLIFLQKYCEKNGTTFVVEKAFLTDSAINIFFNQENPITIDKIGDIYFGVYISNNEIKEGKFSLELRYTIVNDKNQSFSGISDFVFNINHSTGVNTVKDKLINSNKINDLKLRTLDHMKNIKDSELTQNQLYMIFKKIQNSRQKLSTASRDSAKKLYDKNLVTNTLTIIEAFDKINQITTDVEEKIYLERIYNEIIIELGKS